MRVFRRRNSSFALYDSETRQLGEMALGFAKTEFAPFAAKWDEEKVFPVESLRRAAELGFGGVFVGEEFGGSGLSRVHACVVFEQLARGCTSTAAFLSIHNMCGGIIAKHATEKVKKDVLPNLVSMEKICSYCLTEPNSGSDAAAMKTVAKVTDSGFVLTGSKAFISGADKSDYYVVYAKVVNGEKQGISAFLVPKGSKGLSFGAQEKKMGWNSQPTAAVILEDCEIPKENLIGEIGKGFSIAMKALDGGRLSIGACSIGAAQECLERTVKYVSERSQFGKTLSTMQSVQFSLADMAQKVLGSRVFLHYAAKTLDDQVSGSNVICAMAKKQATNNGFDVCNQALQLHGGYGYLKDYEIERFVRDTRVHQILEGTNQIMDVITARSLFSE